MHHGQTLQQIQRARQGRIMDDRCFGLTLATSDVVRIEGEPFTPLAHKVGFVDAISAAWPVRPAGRIGQ
jgi:hypothetical protein